jgi:eukaryotic-like serine/threonine-protein kinase
MSLTAGDRVGSYEIRAPLGAGGMGEVYRAFDDRLEREVALKFLSAAILADEQAHRSIREEALALSHLNHPHICTVYEIGETCGQTYIAMEYVEGQTLSDLVHRGGGLPIEAAGLYAAQIAGALAHAHERGVLHRDLKSSNVIITPDGRAKVLDFGLALRVRESVADESTHTMTQVGLVSGTLAYMAPEVLRGQPANARSDLWALGVTLYELFCGKLPFVGQTPFALVSAIQHEEPEPLPPRVPAAFRAVVQRCLAKEPGRRYQGAREVQAALEATQSGAAFLTVERARQYKLGRWALAAVLAVMVLVAGLLWEHFGRASGPARIRSVAVLPLANFSHDPEQEFFADGMTEQLITDLSKIRALRVISRTSVMQYKGTQKGLSAIARELNVDAVVEGSVMRVGNRVRITAQLVKAASEGHLWAESYERDLREVLSLQGEVARNIAAEIRITLSPEEQARLASRQVDPEVYQLYLKGRFYASQGTEEPRRRGIEFFQQAIQKNDHFAPAHAGLALAYASLASVYAPPHEAMPKAKAAALRALDLDETLSEAHTALANVHLFYEYDWTAAEKELKRAIELNPSSADAHDLYGSYFTALTQFEQGIAESRRAHDLDPLSLLIYSDLLNNLVDARHFDEAVAECRKALEREPNFASAYAVMGLALAEKRQFPEALAAMRKAYQFDPNPTVSLLLAQVQAASGNRVEATKLVHLVEDMAKRRYVCDFEVAQVYTVLGEKDQAFRWLNLGEKQHCDCLVWLQSEPWMDPLHVDPRYVELAKRVFGRVPAGH